MLSCMAQTCYVRYPDDEKDDPKEPGQPNSAIEISAHKLDGYRERGFIQCAADGGALTKVRARGATDDDDEEVVVPAALKDDPVAKEIQGGPVPGKTPPIPPTPSDGGKS